MNNQKPPILGVRRDNLSITFSTTISTRERDPYVRIVIHEDDEEQNAVNIHLEDLKELVSIITQLDATYGTGRLDM